MSNDDGGDDDDSDDNVGDDISDCENINLLALNFATSAGKLWK